MEVIRVENLSFDKCKTTSWFKKDVVFKLGPIDLSVNRGETIAIIGENSAGKSLLAKLLVGAVAPTTGTIWMHERKDGKEAKISGPECRAGDIRMMFQQTSEAMNPGITVGQILDEPLKLNTTISVVERKQIVEETLIKVGLLREHYHFYRHMLSDGQQQRIAMARALLLNPKVIVADEPFAALDPSIRSQTVNLFLQLQQEMGLAFIFISHNLGIVRHIADRIIVMDEGQIIETGETETIFRWPKHPITKKLIMSYQSLAAIKYQR